MKACVRLLLFSLLCTALVSKADLLSATLDYNQNNYRKAFKQFQQLAELGNKDAIYNIGVMHLHGQGVDKNPARAYAWFSLAAEFGLEEARSAAQIIANQLKQPALLAQEQQALFGKLNYALFSDTLKPVFSAAPVNESSEKLPERIYTLDPQYPKEAYEKGIEGWVWLEFDVDESGAVTDIDIIDAFPNRTFDRAIYNAVKHWRYQPYQVNGQNAAYRNRSLLYHFTTFKGKRYQASFAKQKREYQRKISRLIEEAEQGNALVQYYIANWMVTDDHNATRLLKYHWQQDTAGSDLLLDSAINGYPNSQYRLGANLLRGEFTQADRKKGLNWLLYAAQAGNSFAQYRLARELLDKRYVEYDPEKAQRWLEQAAEQDIFRAKRDLLALYIEQKQLATAQKFISTLTSNELEHPEILIAQSQLMIRNKKVVEAKTLANAAIKQAQSRSWSDQPYQAFLQANF